MPIWVSRAGWQARPARARSTNVRPRDGGFAIHYTGADADEQADHANCARRVRGIQSFHMDGRGWSDIAYSFLCCLHGSVFEGRGWGVRTAANGTDDGNDRYLAICFLGNDTAGRDDVTEAGREAIRWVVDEGRARHDVGPGVKPHSAFKATSCPGDELRGWIAQGLSVFTTPPPPTPPPSHPHPSHSHATPDVRMVNIGGTWRGQVLHREFDPDRWFTQGPGPWWEVADVQSHLNRHEARDYQGQILRVDGMGGYRTYTAIRNFQASRALTADGWVGPATWARLHEGV